MRIETAEKNSLHCRSTPIWLPGWFFINPNLLTLYSFCDIIQQESDHTAMIKAQQERACYEKRNPGSASYRVPNLHGTYRDRLPHRLGLGTGFNATHVGTTHHRGRSDQIIANQPTPSCRKPARFGGGFSVAIFSSHQDQDKLSLCNSACLYRLDRLQKRVLNANHSEHRRLPPAPYHANHL